MAEKEKEKKKSKFTDACYLMDYVDVLSGIGKTANPEGYHSFKAIECTPNYCQPNIRNWNSRVLKNKSCSYGDIATKSKIIQTTILTRRY